MISPGQNDHRAREKGVDDTCIHIDMYSGVKLLCSIEARVNHCSEVNTDTRTSTVHG